ncbi:GNAT family N-acetyltransferase [Cohaesibacter gelatinilyticus]|uniref:Protein N-acetyltransferase, RimJ/RimL family n=1 Tax=Cohaesibacter gelatinilyticus TaxID=372072 RepID=A0A285PJR3_9HYPH|nr:GNAT family N-acetyltransferase [Cohaesibacter gelatinilyticus]SNZ21523.1 Protein N-acetyltransferase, RimJ/RimL family [Cohaesibacter gelatinilyticus]
MRMSDGCIFVQPLSIDDKIDYCHLLSDPRVSGSLKGEIRPGSGVRLLSDCSIEELYEKFEYSLENQIEQTPCVFGVGLLDADKLIGSIGSYEIDADRIGLSYWLGAPFQGQGYGTKLLNLYRGSSLQHFKRRQLLADVASDNVASINVLKKTGFREVADTRSSDLTPLPGRRIFEWMLRNSRQKG